MTTSTDAKVLLKALPGVDQVMLKANNLASFKDIPRSVLVSAIRDTIDRFRKEILANAKMLRKEDFSLNVLLKEVEQRSIRILSPKLKPLINATGIVVHTNLGRSLLAKDALNNLIETSENYSNLEYDLDAGKRGSRYSLVEKLLCELTGAEAAMAVNNNAAAVLLCLNTMARGKEAIVSRGELVEIGGSFRIPDVMEKSGAILKEVGTTNRTHARDYENAITENTGLLLKVHTSNYSVVGFTADVPLKTMVKMGAQHHVAVMEDLGSGTLVDFSRYGLVKEPTVQESVASGIDLVTFSGDKLLGGPQAGIILGKKEVIDQIKQNPLTRALRIDKLTLAALESTLRLYRDEEKAISSIPTLRLITRPLSEIVEKARILTSLIKEVGDDRIDVKRLDRSSKTGGGALPLLDLPSQCIAVRIEGMSANELEAAMRGYCPPIIGRIENELFLMDLRTIKTDDFDTVQEAFRDILTKTAGKDHDI